jgi:hypothetical protein
VYEKCLKIAYGNSRWRCNGKIKHMRQEYQRIIDWVTSKMNAIHSTNDVEFIQQMML